MTTTPDIDAIRKRLEAATKGPWCVSMGTDISTARAYPDNPDVGFVDFHPDCELIIETGSGWDGKTYGAIGKNRDADLALIANAPQDLARLLAALDGAGARSGG